MKVVLSVFLLNLFILHQILAVPVDDTTEIVVTGLTEIVELGTTANLLNAADGSFGTSFNPENRADGSFGTSFNPENRADGSFGTSFNPENRMDGSFGTSSNPENRADGSFGTSFNPENRMDGSFGTSSNPENRADGSFGTSFNPENRADGLATTIESSTSSDEETTVELTTVDTDLSTEASSNVTAVSTDDVTAENDTLVVTTIATIYTDDLGNATDSDASEEVTTAAPKPSTTKGPTKLQVVLETTTLKVQRGQSIELVCNVLKADNTTIIYWIQEEPERRYAVIDSKGVTLSGSQATLRVRITFDDPSKIGKYTCMAQDAKGNSDTAVLTMEEESRYYQPPQLYPDVAPPTHHHFQHLRIVAPEMEDGQYVEIQCEGAAPDDEGRVQWYFNERLLNDENPLYPRGKTLHIRPISREYLGNYRCSIPGGNYGDGNSILTFSRQPTYDVQPNYNQQPNYNERPNYNEQPNYNQQPTYDVAPVFNPPSPLSIEEGASRIIQAPSDYDRAYWTRSDGQLLPTDIYQIGNDLQITNARSDHSGTYYCQLYRQDGTQRQVSYDIYVQPSQPSQPTQPPQSHTGGLPKILIQPQSIDLKEGQRMIVRYTVVSQEPIDIQWHKYTDQGYQPLPAGFTAQSDRLVLHRAAPDSAGIYQVTVRNSHGEVRQELRVNVQPRHHQHAGGHHQHVEDHHQHQQHQDHEQHHDQQQQEQQHQQPQQQYVTVTAEPSGEVSIAPGEKTTVTCHVKGTEQYKLTWTRYAHDTSLPSFAHQQGNDLIIAPPLNTPAEQMYLQCQVHVPNQPEPYSAYTPLIIRGAKRKRRNLRK